MKKAFAIGNCAFDDVSGRNRLGRIGEDNQTLHELSAFRDASSIIDIIAIFYLCYEDGRLAAKDTGCRHRFEIFRRLGSLDARAMTIMPRVGAFSLTRQSARFRAENVRSTAALAANSGPRLYMRALLDT